MHHLLIRTGEIMNASLYLYHDLLKWNNIQRFVQTSQVDPDARHLRLPDDLMSETLRCAVRREVGFALGLIENMAGSFCYTDRFFTVGFLYAEIWNNCLCDG